MNANSRLLIGSPCADGTHAIADCFPVVGPMALLAAIAKLTVMHVVSGVAGDAGTAQWRRGLALGGWLLVTALAAHLAVRAIEAVFRAPVMVEVPHRPGAGVMAGIALTAQPFLVLVLGRVTGITVTRGIPVTAGLVAALARCGGVAPSQGKARARMVELGHGPGLVAMALLAAGTQLGLVLVVLLVAADAVHGRVAVAAQVLVAGRALHLGLGVGIAQGKAGAVVVEATGCGFPVTFGMALRALLTQVASVLVILLVAADALLGRFLEHGALVALLALGLGMLAQQREGGGLVVELGRFLPAALGVAVAALLAQGLLVLVILAVAGVALLADLGAVDGAGVAVRAAGAAVLAAQRVARVDIVVERGGLPLLGVVAAVTLLAVLPLVTLLVVVLAVAGVAVLRCFLVIGGLVAVGAFGIHVLASQGKPGGVVVELGFLPQVLVVAVRALGTQRALVHVVLAVAGVAFVRCVTEFLARHVALHTFHLLVLGTQAEIRGAMVEARLVKVRNRRTTPLVVGMAGTARLRLHLAVETGLGAHISTDFLVAVHAQPVLGLAVKLHVAVLALVVHLGMRLDQLARRNDGFDALGARAGAQADTAQQGQPKPESLH